MCLCIDNKMSTVGEMNLIKELCAVNEQTIPLSNIDSTFVF